MCVCCRMKSNGSMCTLAALAIAAALLQGSVQVQGIVAGGNPPAPAPAPAPPPAPAPAPPAAPPMPLIPPLSFEEFCAPQCGITGEMASCEVTDDCCIGDPEGVCSMRTCSLVPAQACPVTGRKGCFCTSSADCDDPLECASEGPLKNTCQVRHTSSLRRGTPSH